MALVRMAATYAWVLAASLALLGLSVLVRIIPRKAAAVMEPRLTLQVLAAFIVGALLLCASAATALFVSATVPALLGGALLALVGAYILLYGLSVCAVAQADCEID